MASTSTAPNDGLGAYEAIPLTLVNAPPTVGDNSHEFIWNQRPCKGSELHVALIQSDVERVRAILEKEEELPNNDRQIERRYTYTTVKPDGTDQEGSGKAIHLAVTRESTEIVKLLLQHAADLDSKVTRGGKDHYDSLHAAVFSEGRGGSIKMVEYLLEAKAKSWENQNRAQPLHVAFQVGGRVAKAIPMLQDHAKQCGVSEAIETAVMKETPLAVGIMSGKLSAKELAEYAPLRTEALKTFIYCDATSLPLFLDRVGDAKPESMSAEKLVDSSENNKHNVTVADICHCLREYPPAAIRLLDYLTITPKVANQAWNALPSRLGFGPRNLFELVQDSFNPPREAIYRYEITTTWEYDAAKFVRPEWHELINPKKKGENHKYGRSFDVDIKVCLLPEVVNSEFLSAVLECNSDEICDSEVVKGIVRSVWWGGAYRVDVIQLFFTLLGLALLVLQRSTLDPMLDPEGMDHASNLTDRRLRGHSDPEREAMARDLDKWHEMSKKSFDESAAIRFLGARGIVDFIHELVQFRGYAQIQRRWDYFSLYNMIDLLRAFLAVSVYAGVCREHAVQVILIFMYWFRIFEVSFSENLLRELLPITQLVSGLIPSCVVCVTAVCAFTHAKWAMHTGTSLWPYVFYDSFALLMTQNMPQEDKNNPFDLLFSFIAICCFSVFFLNIFIGVIGDAYTTQKDQADLSVMKKKAGLCLAFLLRGASLPNRLFRKIAVVEVVFYGSMALVLLLCSCMALEIFPPFHEIALMVLMVALQLMGLLACYQDPESVWSANEDNASPRYLWIFQKRAPRTTNETADPDAEVNKNGLGSS